MPAVQVDRGEDGSVGRVGLQLVDELDDRRATVRLPLGIDGWVVPPGGDALQKGGDGLRLDGGSEERLGRMTIGCVGPDRGRPRAAGGINQARDWNPLVHHPDHVVVGPLLPGLTNAEGAWVRGILSFNDVRGHIGAWEHPWNAKGKGKRHDRRACTAEVGKSAPRAVDPHGVPGHAHAHVSQAK